MVQGLEVMKKVIFFSISVCVVLAAIQQWFQYQRIDAGFHKLIPGMSKTEVVKILGSPTGTRIVKIEIAPSWDGEASGSDLGRAVEVSCYGIIAKRWCVGFNKDGQVVSRWEPELLE